MKIKPTIGNSFPAESFPMTYDIMAISVDLLGTCYL